MHTTLDLVTIGDRSHLLGEGPRWIDGTLWWLDIEAGELWSKKQDRDVECILKLPYQIGSFACTESGGFVLATRNGLEAFDLETGQLTGILDPQPTRDTRFNDGRVDARGRFWAGTMALDPARYGEPIGILYCVDTDGSIVAKVSGLTISNGVDWSNDSTIMYLNDTMRGLVWAFDFNDEMAAISRPRIFARLDTGHGLPDGLLVDAHDHVWIAAIGAGTLIRYTPNGEISCKIAVGTRWPTALAFGGADLSTLYVTTSCHLMSAGEHDPRAGRVMTFPTFYRGRPEHRSRLATAVHTYTLKPGQPLHLQRP
jgi:sugar lactone lactonase YvrE